jgi:hypothetical protein
MFILDFDDTIFNTSLFKQKRHQALREIGITDDLYAETYLKARNDANGFFVYSNERHADVLVTYGFKKSDVMKTLIKTTSNETLQNLLVPDARPFLEWIKEHKDPAVLLSLGESSFQELKTKGADIQKYVDRTFFVQASKEDIIQMLYDSGDLEYAWFINDKPLETKRIAERFSWLRPILKMSPKFTEEEYKETNIPYFKTLPEIKDYIEQYA